MITLVAAFLLAAQVGGDSCRTDVTRYLSDIKAVEKRAAGASVESAFDSAARLRACVLRDVGSSTYLESLDDAAYDVLAKQLRGIIVGRDGALLAEPDPAFFLSLARRNGAPEDVDFFENYVATVPDGLWKSYLTQQTDVTACTEFGNGELVSRYRGWLKYRTDHPDSYQKAVAAQLEAIEVEVSQSGCACGDLSEVRDALEQFYRSFPDSPVAPKVKSRIERLEQGQSRIRANCISG